MSTASQSSRTYILGTAAIRLAAFGLVVAPDDRTTAVVLGSAEIVCILTVLFVTRLSRIQRWHSSGRELRLFAEWLRQYRFHFVTTTSGVASKQPAHLAKYAHAEMSWMKWMAGAVHRAAGLPSSTVSDDCSLQSIKEWILTGHVQRQADYHRAIVEVIRSRRTGTYKG